MVAELVNSCRNHDFTDIIMIHEHRGEPDGLVVCHLPYGPTAYFGIYNAVRPPEPLRPPACPFASCAVNSLWQLAVSVLASRVLVRSRALRTWRCAKHMALVLL